MKASYPYFKSFYKISIHSQWSDFHDVSTFRRKLARQCRYLFKTNILYVITLLWSEMKFSTLSTPQSPHRGQSRQLLLCKGSLWHEMCVATFSHVAWGNVEGIF
jgi:hypothetical protein